MRCSHCAQKDLHVSFLIPQPALGAILFSLTKLLPPWCFVVTPGVRVVASSARFLQLRAQWRLRKKLKHKFACVCGAIACAGGSTTAERNWLRQRLCEFVVKIPGKKKPKFKFKLPLIGDTCRSAWILTVGFPGRKNSRIANLEAAIRNPALRTARTHATCHSSVTKKCVICGRLPQRIYFASLSAQPKFELFVSHI